jgi:hypothetical protein
MKTNTGASLLTKLIALLSISCVSIGISIASLVYGFGLEVKSWVALILLGVFAQTFTHMILGKLLKEIRE